MAKPRINLSGPKKTRQVFLTPLPIQIKHHTDIMPYPIGTLPGYFPRSGNQALIVDRP